MKLYAFLKHSTTNKQARFELNAATAFIGMGLMFNLTVDELNQIRDAIEDDEWISFTSISGVFVTIAPTSKMAIIATQELEQELAMYN